jgi:hypothetical protein
VFIAMFGHSAMANNYFRDLSSVTPARYFDLRGGSYSGRRSKLRRSRETLLGKQAVTTFYRSPDGGIAMGGPGIIRDRFFPRIFGRAVVGAVIFSFIFNIFLGFIFC